MSELGYVPYTCGVSAMILKLIGTMGAGDAGQLADRVESLYADALVASSLEHGGNGGPAGAARGAKRKG
jgi:hypothetical protein